MPLVVVADDDERGDDYQTDDNDNFDDTDAFHPGAPRYYGDN